MSDRALARVALAAAALGVPLEVSLEKQRAWLDQVPGLTVVAEAVESLAGRLAVMPRAWDVVVRAPGAGEALRRVAVEGGARLVDHAVVLNGRIEMLPLLREQSISETLHRLGNVLPKPAQVRRQTPLT
jgi:RHH-type proline utilization regulon transcriptional repressor/proline dehydrogenase/delta 1-pyrroline-5-carboxylate dehydrogenase